MSQNISRAPARARRATATGRQVLEAQVVAGQGPRASWAALAEVLSWPDKSPALIAALIDGERHGAYPFGTAATMDQTIPVLLAEPALTRAHLETLASFVRGRGRWDYLAQICCHARADAHIVADSLWQARPSSTRALALSTGMLLPVVIKWVREALCNDGSELHATPTDAQFDQIVATASRWEQEVAGNTALHMFLLIHAADFDTEDDLFAVGHAVAATPGR